MLESESVIDMLNVIVSTLSDHYDEQLDTAIELAEQLKNELTEYFDNQDR